MSDLLAPASLAELIEVIHSSQKVLAVGARTKPRLSAMEATKVCTLKLAGIVEYEPSEYTFTARAGTTLREIVETLAARGQYLPFDPMLVEAGATLGGTVSAGLSGPGRFRYGGLKDFILGAQFIDGSGRALRVGGKVVKNAAGFDLPKFLVGSLGRFGVLTELTFKVFPAPASTLTLKLFAGNIETAAQMLSELARSRWEPHALETLPGGHDLCVRLGGPAEALASVAKDILSRYRGEILDPQSGSTVWTELNEFKWAYSGGCLVKLVLTIGSLPLLVQELGSIDGSRLHVSSGGNVAFVSLPDPDQAAALNQLLKNQSLSGIMLRGKGALWQGIQPRYNITEAVKAALDPQKRFPGLDD